MHEHFLPHLFCGGGLPGSGALPSYTYNCNATARIVLGALEGGEPGYSEAGFKKHHIELHVGGRPVVAHVQAEKLEGLIIVHVLCIIKCKACKTYYLPSQNLMYCLPSLQTSTRFQRFPFDCEGHHTTTFPLPMYSTRL